MGDSVRIGDRVYHFQSIEGHQFVNGEEYKCIRDNETATIKISDSLPINEQLALASLETTVILGQQNKAKERNRIKELTQAAADGSVEQAAAEFLAVPLVKLTNTI